MKQPEKLPIIRVASQEIGAADRVVIVKQQTNRDIAPLVDEYVNEIADQRVVLVSVPERVNETVRKWLKNFFSRGAP